LQLNAGCWAFKIEGEMVAAIIQKQSLAILVHIRLPQYAKSS